MSESRSDAEYTRNLGRNMAIGLVVAYGVTVGLCVLAIGDLGDAMAIATVPGLFAGPYLGLLITLIAAVRPRPAEPIAAGQDAGARMADVA